MTTTIHKTPMLQKKINKQIVTLQRYSKNRCIQLMVHWNGFEIIEFHTIASLMEKYDDIRFDKDISHISLARKSNKYFETYNNLFNEILIGEEVEIDNMTIVRIS